MSNFIPQDEPETNALAENDAGPVESTTDDFDLGATGSGSKAIPAPTAILLGVIVAGAGAIYAMRTMGMGPGVVDAVNIDYPTGAEGVDQQAHAELLNELGAATSLEFQVGPEDISKNPFRLSGVLRPLDSDIEDTPAPAGLTPEQLAERERQLQEQRDRDVLASLRSLELNSVIGGSRGICSINGVTYRVGDELTPGITIDKIHGRSVDFRTSSAVWTLTMGQNEPVKKSQGS